MNSPHLSRFPNYNRFDPPMALDFANWTRREARSYFDWFIDHIPERMNELRRFARFAMPDCDFDGLPDSLRCLGKLLIEHVATRPRTAKERADVLEDVPERLRSVIDEDDWELTDETISLCIDVGIYFAEVLRRRYPGLEWRLWTRRHVQQNRPSCLDFRQMSHSIPFSSSATSLTERCVVSAIRIS